MRLCLFCSSNADSVEDAWPLWLASLFKGARPMAMQAERHGVSLPSWSSSQPKLTIRCVCEECNNGWMSRLENRVRPHLQPLLTGPSVLDVDAQTTITIWAVKTAMVLEGKDADLKKGYTQPQRERFRLRTEIPWRTSVWLAASATADAFMSTKNRHMGATANDFAGVSVTMAFGAVVLQVLTMRVPPEVGPDTLVTTEVRRGPWAEATLQIWPPREGATWPPSIGLNGEVGLNLLADRFSTTECGRDEIDTMTV
jgi:hypothetical protein